MAANPGSAAAMDSTPADPAGGLALADVGAEVLVDDGFGQRAFQYGEYGALRCAAIIDGRSSLPFQWCQPMPLTCSSLSA